MILENYKNTFALIQKVQKIKNTGGVRKLRWAIRDKGKRGGVRIII